MIYAFMALLAGCMLLGGAISFHRQGKPAWSVLLLALIGAGAALLALWRIQQGA